jgi:hypothetical protein
MAECEDAVASLNILKDLKKNIEKVLRNQRQIYTEESFGLRESDATRGGIVWW